PLSVSMFLPLSRPYLPPRYLRIPHVCPVLLLIARRVGRLDRRGICLRMIKGGGAILPTIEDNYLQVSRQAVVLRRPATLDKEMTMITISSLPQLDVFDIDPERGFLPSEDPLRRLPPAFDAWEEAAANLPKIL